MRPTAAPMNWRRSMACATNACIEVAEQPDAFFVRDSKNIAGSVLKFSRQDWGSFVQGIRGDDFEPR